MKLFFQKKKIYLLSFVIIIFLTHCPKQPDISVLLNERISNPYHTTQILPVYFSTPRGSQNSSLHGCNNQYYSSSITSSLRYGSCSINVPSHHSIGSLDSSIQGSRDRFFAFLGMDEKNEMDFFKEIKKSPHSEILVFVHGFNVGFEEAILRASQIKYDMKYQGEVIVFSWPAGSEDESLLGQLFIKDTYHNNYEMALATRGFFKKFMNELVIMDKTIHLIVHSMGHQVVVPVIAEMNAASPNKKLIGELVLNAPDYDSNEFLNISPALIGISKRVTLYCSPGDNALLASQKVNGGTRAGMCMRYSGIDVINVNEVDDPVFGFGGLGHGYYSSRAILTDIYQVLLGISVEKRLFIRKSGINNSEEYVIRK